MEILDDEHDRAPSRAGDDHLQQRLKCPGLDGLGRDIGQRLGPTRHAEQLKQKRGVLVSIEAHLGEASGDLHLRDRGLVAFVDGAVSRTRSMSGR